MLNTGTPGQTYHVSARNERPNLELVREVCDLVDEFIPGTDARRDFIEMVPDRPGRHRRYALDPGKIETDLSCRPAVEFDVALRRPVEWYLDNADWAQAAIQ